MSVYDRRGLCMADGFGNDPSDDNLFEGRLLGEWTVVRRPKVGAPCERHKEETWQRQADGMLKCPGGCTFDPATPRWPWSWFRR